MGLTFNLGRVSPSVFTDSSLNVGIGGSPSGSYKLEVTGTGRFSGNVFLSNGSGNKITTLGGSPSANDGASLELIPSNSARNWAIRANWNVSGALEFVPSTAAGGSSFSTTPSMIISSAGLVGIGSGASGNPAAYGFFAVSNVITVNTLAGVAAGFSDNTYGTTRLYIQNGINGINVDQAFVISTGGGVPTERLRITSTGNVGINNTAPSEKLSVTGSISFSNYLLVGTAGYIGVGNQIQGGWTSTDLLILNNNNGGKIAINTTNGSAYNGLFLVSGATSWSPITSDVRTKKNFETTQGLAEVLQIEPTKYHLITDDDNSVKRLGFKAQNLQLLIPEMVISTGNKADDGSDYLTIVPDYLLPVLVKAIQELSAQNQDLKSRLDKAGL